MIRAAFGKGRKLFVPFIVCGHPNAELSFRALVELADAGADIIELGVPFSDPIADGPVIQKASERALKGGMDIVGVIAQVKRLRELGYSVPIILFSYLNPIIHMGYENFIDSARNVGVDGVLIVDLPPEEGIDFYTMAQKGGLDIVLLASPTTDHARLELYRELSPAFVYYISRAAVTGMRDDVSASLHQEIEVLRSHLPGMYVVVGFGVSTTNHIRTISRIADGVVMGSRLVDALDKSGLEGFSLLAKEAVKAVNS